VKIRRYCPLCDETRLEGGILWIYDSTREKWLSSNSVFLSAGKKGRAGNIYLRLNNEQSSTAYRIPRDGTIVASSIQIRDKETCSLKIIKNDQIIYTLFVDDSTGNSDIIINVDINKDDLLRFYLGVPENFVRDPAVLVEILWRNEG
jgi:hypothetical protein